MKTSSQDATMVTVQSDASVASSTPNQAYGEYSGLLVGHSQGDLSEYGSTRAYLRFDMRRYTGGIVRNTKLRLYLAYSDLPIVVELHSVTENWEETTITWNTQPESRASPFTQASVGREVGWVEIALPEAVVQRWLDNPDANFGIVMKAPSAEANPGPIRNFRARESEQSDQAPVLVFDYQAPTPTPTPTATFTPTPGLDYIHLGNNPRGELAGGDTVTYTITLQNGPTLLSNLIVTGTIPTALNVITDSITAPGGWIPSQTENRINWRSSDMAADDVVVLSYAAQRQTATPTNTPTLTPTMTITPTITFTPTATIMPDPTLTEETATPEGSQTPTRTPSVTPSMTPIPSSLSIAKSGPISVATGTDINYVLTVTNSRNEALTGLTMTDYVPVGTEISDYGGGAATMPPSQAIQWQIPLIAPGDSVTRGYAVRTTTGITQVVNNLYFVEVIADGRLIERVVGGETVVTSVVDQPCLDCGTWDGPIRSALVPQRLSQSVEDDSSIIHGPVQASWDGATQTVESNPVRNPSFPEVYLPSISRQ